MIDFTDVGRMCDRELDLYIARTVTELPQAGFWQRVAVTDSAMEKTGFGAPRKAMFAPNSPPIGFGDIKYAVTEEPLQLFAIPYYSSDLNVVSDVTKSLLPPQISLYLNAMSSIIPVQTGCAFWDLHTASARQRAEALALCVPAGPHVGRVR